MNQNTGYLMGLNQSSKTNNFNLFSIVDWYWQLDNAYAVE